MKPFPRPRRLWCAAVLSAVCLAAQAQDAPPGAFVESLLAIAKEANPEYASMRFEAQAAAERVTPAGALPDPKFRVEWMDVTKSDTQAPALWPSDVGSTRYTLMQDLPWFGKRDLKREVAGFEAEAAKGRVMGTWSELAARIKSTHALRYYHHRNEDLSREILDLMDRLEKIAQVRYAGGLSAQQDVIRAQIEQTNMKNELLALESEGRQMDARLNALLARPAAAPLAAPRRLRPLPSPAQLDPAVLQTRLRASNPGLFADDSRLKAAEKSRELAYKNRYPDFTLSVSPTQVQSDIKEWSLMVELNIPLQQSSRRAQEREAEAMLAAARARKEASANQALADLAENLAGIDAARRTAELATTSLLPQSELTFSAALAAYENGKVDFASLLDAQRQIRQAKQSQLKAQFEAQMRLAEIEKLLGEDL
jgi:cobalt-zinc-cadmium efflux system outer membrane protein